MGSLRAINNYKTLLLELSISTLADEINNQNLHTQETYGRSTHVHAMLKVNYSYSHNHSQFLTSPNQEAKSEKDHTWPVWNSFLSLVFA